MSIQKEFDVQNAYEGAKKLAKDKGVSTNSILEPILIKQGYMDKNGMTLKTHSIVIGLSEDLDQIPTGEE
jgi:hypothetical protein